MTKHQQKLGTKIGPPPDFVMVVGSACFLVSTIECVIFNKI